MEWIDIKNQEPPKETKLYEEFVCYANGFYLVGTLYGKEGIWICESEESMLENVTHWMLLKEPV